MNILFLTISKINCLTDRGIYTDLLRKFAQEGHHVYVVSPVERRERKATKLSENENATILNVKTLNLQKTNIIEKGLGLITIEYQFLSSIKKYFSKTKFDIIIYPTPPITFSKVISYIKHRDNAYCYLLLKDIFPQNAVDMKLLREGGVLHNFFLRKERQLYMISDKIGCMSEANRNYVIKHNPDINPDKIEINPNSIEPVVAFSQNLREKQLVREKYSIPQNKMIFVYGGNLGKPQGVDFLLEVIENIKINEIHFLVIGAGTEYNRIKTWFDIKRPVNASLLSALPKEDYDRLLNACDVGLIFLHKDFTIPNFPSRLLSYLEMKMPVIAATDYSTDIGEVIEKAGCGYWVLSGDIKNMKNAVEKIVANREMYNQMKENAWELLQNQYNVNLSYEIIKESAKIKME